MSHLKVKDVLAALKKPILKQIFVCFQILVQWPWNISLYIMENTNVRYLNIGTSRCQKKYYLIF